MNLLRHQPVNAGLTTATTEAQEMSIGRDYRSQATGRRRAEVEIGSATPEMIQPVVRLRMSSLSRGRRTGQVTKPGGGTTAWPQGGPTDLPRFCQLRGQARRLRQNSTKAGLTGAIS